MIIGFFVFSYQITIHLNSVIGSIINEKVNMS